MDTWKAYSFDIYIFPSLFLQENTLPFQFYDIWWNIGVVRGVGEIYPHEIFVFSDTLPQMRTVI